jgi:phosphoglycerol transferase MdoB-like AlkP superfamily enzyme
LEIFVARKWFFVGVVALLLVLGTAALTYAAYTGPVPANSTRLAETIKTLFLCLGGIGVLLPITMNALGAIEQRSFDKIENTFDLLSKWDDQHLLKARNFTRKIKKNRAKISDEDLLKEIDGNEELEQSVILVTNYFEHVRFSIAKGRINVADFKLSLGPTIVDIIDRFKPYFARMPEDVRQDLDKLKAMLG